MKLLFAMLTVAVLGLAALTLVSTIGENPQKVSAATSRQDQAPPGCVEVDSERVDFGVSGVGESGRHTFVIRNVGRGELKLSEGPATCGCTSGTLSRTSVPPGEQATLQLNWTPPQAAELFSQGVLVKTNDPARRQLQFMAVGKVQSYLVAEPEMLVFSEVHKGDAKVGRVVLQSQVWDDFDVFELECAHPHLNVEVQPADEQTLERSGARSARQLAVSVSPDMPGGMFLAAVNVAVRPKAHDDTDGKPRRLTIQVQGEVVGNVSVQGGGLDRIQSLPLGTLPAGKGCHRSLAIFVRGDRQDLAVGDIITTPTWLTARVGSREIVSPKLSRYRLEIEVPKSALPGDYIEARAAEVVIPTDHPEAPELRIKVEFVISDSI